MEGLISYLIAAMMTWVPLHSHVRFEAPEDTLARYTSIAHDAASVALDQAESPLFDGPEGRTRTALLILSVASYESYFVKSIDDGFGRGDHGSSYCLMQVRVGSGTTREGWSGADLVHDRTLCFRAALHILQASFDACRSLPMDDRVSAYATGHCFRNAHVSRTRVDRARAWWMAHTDPLVGQKEAPSDESTRAAED
jgi:hypothetical protein